MRVSRLYTEQPLASNSEQALDARCSHYLATVLRAKVGTRLYLFNGDGGEYPAEIVSLSKREVHVSLGEAKYPERESPLQIHLGIAVSRGERMDWVVQKSTELGVASISPLFSERTEVKLKGERLQKKAEHWRQVAISACEQCGRVRVPDIAAAISIDDWLPRQQQALRLVLHHRHSQTLQNFEKPAGGIALLIGPEGGLSEAEIDSATAQGFQALQLGPRVLRTETAPLSAISLLQYRWGDFA